MDNGGRNRNPRRGALNGHRLHRTRRHEQRQRRERLLQRVIMQVPEEVEAFIEAIRIENPQLLLAIIPPNANVGEAQLVPWHQGAVVRALARWGIPLTVTGVAAYLLMTGHADILPEFRLENLAPALFSMVPKIPLFDMDPRPFLNNVFAPAVDRWITRPYITPVVNAFWTTMSNYVKGLTGTGGVPVHLPVSGQWISSNDWSSNLLSARECLWREGQFFEHAQTQLARGVTWEQLLLQAKELVTDSCTFYSPMSFFRRDKPNDPGLGPGGGPAQIA